MTIVGAGGIGCALGHALAAADYSVTFVESDTAKLDWGNQHGVLVDQGPPQPAAFVAFEDWRPSRSL